MLVVSQEPRTIGNNYIYKCFSLFENILRGKKSKLSKVIKILFKENVIINETKNVEK